MARGAGEGCGGGAVAAFRLDRAVATCTRAADRAI
jgi:hypothetical protein